MAELHVGGVGETIDIQTDVDPKSLSGLGKIRSMLLGIICIGMDWDLSICPVKTNIRITRVRITHVVVNIYKIECK